MELLFPVLGLFELLLLVFEALLLLEPCVVAVDVEDKGSVSVWKLVEQFWNKAKNKDIKIISMNKIFFLEKDVLINRS